MQRPTPVSFAGATSTTAIVVSNSNINPPLATVTFMLDVTTVATGVVIIEGQVGTGSYISIGSVNMQSLSPQASGNISLTDNTSYIFQVPDCSAFSNIRLRAVSGTFTAATAYAYGVDITGSTKCLQPVVMATNSVAQTISSSSATALVVGPNGTTNPTFTVATNTASAATGLKITSAAAASGVALVVTSSGTDEPMTINTKGAGVLSLNTTATGQVYMSRGALKVEVMGRTVTALGTAQSSSPTIAQLLTGIVTQTSSTGGGAVTLPTGTAISAGMPLTPVTGDSFEVAFCNLGGGQTLTITGATGSTVVGEAAVATATGRKLLFTCTGANAWTVVCY